MAERLAASPSCLGWCLKPNSLSWWKVPLPPQLLASLGHSDLGWALRGSLLISCPSGWGGLSFLNPHSHAQTTSSRWCDASHPGFLANKLR